MIEVPCPYCPDQLAHLVHSSEVYGPGHDYGMMWLCPTCRAYVGTHKNSKTHKPLGTPANDETRTARKRAHAAFDPLWKRKMQRDEVSRKVARNAGYEWLAKKLGIEVNDCHIGAFDAETCYEVVRVCSPYYRRKS